MRSLLIAAVLAVLPLPAFAESDPNQWLETTGDPAVTSWAEQQNARSQEVLQGDPRYPKVHATALAVLSAQGRIAAPEFVGAQVFNFWQDAKHVRGVWRRTSLASYRRGKPDWETVLDVDALAKRENANWVWEGATCRPPAYDRCLIELSDAGEDATEVREFDLKTRTFVEDGFRLPTGKQTVQWLDPDTLILNRDWGPGTTTESGYGFIVKTLKRGQPLEEAAEVFRGEPGDVSAYPEVFRDGQGRQAALIIRGTDFFHDEFYLVEDGKAVRLKMPQRATVYGLLEGNLVFTIEEDWNTRGFSLQPHKAGALVAYPLGQLRVDANWMTNALTEVFAPTPRQSIEQVAVTANRVVAVINDNVRSRVISFADQGEWGWPQTELPAPENAAVRLVDAAHVGDHVFYQAEGFLTPPSLELADAATGKGRTVSSAPPAFKARNLVVEQHEVASKDGTQIPYFLVRRKDAPMDGSTPTLLYGYGGFQISRLPEYDAVLGRLWLERGGAYAVANIRGGGEFGPAWHAAAMNEKRQNAYDDFAAVAEDLIARKVTSPRRLGIYGRSNGGLLMGVAMTQHPELFNAVVIESPLLDMLRYHEMPPGASWIGEYGDPRIPEEHDWIARYSPYQALKAGVDYPLPYITTNSRDDRVNPGHARKFAARLSELGDPYLYYEDTEGGHPNGADPKANARRWAMHYIFLMQRLMD